MPERLKLFCGRAAQIGGDLSLDARSQPVAEVNISLIPAERNRTDLYVTRLTDQNGRFTMAGITPGDYKIFSWDVVAPNGHYDPEWLRRYEQLGRSVRIGEGSNEKRRCGELSPCRNNEDFSPLWIEGGVACRRRPGGHVFRSFALFQDSPRLTSFATPPASGGDNAGEKVFDGVGADLATGAAENIIEAVGGPWQIHVEMRHACLSESVAREHCYGAMQRARLDRRVKAALGERGA